MTTLFQMLNSSTPATRNLQLAPLLSQADTMHVYLVRHAAAYERNATKWPNDDHRPLTPEGRRKFGQLVSGLPDLPDWVDLMITSPLARAKETAEILQAKAGWPEAVVWDELRPE